MSIKLFRTVPGLIIAGLLGVVIAHFMVLLSTGCTPPAQTVDQSITASAYQAQLDGCVIKAKADDGGRAEADACMCGVAARYGRLDSGTLNCDGGAP